MRRFQPRQPQHGQPHQRLQAGADQDDGAAIAEDMPEPGRQQLREGRQQRWHRGEKADLRRAGLEEYRECREIGLAAA